MNLKLLCITVNNTLYPVLQESVNSPIPVPLVIDTDNLGPYNSGGDWLIAYREKNNAHDANLSFVSVHANLHTQLLNVLGRTSIPDVIKTDGRPSH